MILPVKSSGTAPVVDVLLTGASLPMVAAAPTALPSPHACATAITRFTPVVKSSCQQTTAMTFALLRYETPSGRRSGLQSDAEDVMPAILT